MDATPLAVPAVRILLVDDFEPWRRTIFSILSVQQYLHVVGHAADGLEAVQKVSELKPDLILLDISLPSLDGIKAATCVFKVFPHIKIIFLTQHRDPGIVRAALSTGAQGYVLKSDAGTEILSAVEGVLRGDQFLSSGLDGHSPIRTSDD
jgi:DNA-binding NarL/FixJ family response regulator